MVEIRTYEERDEAAVAALWREVFPDEPAHNVPEDVIARKLAVQRELFFVAVEGGEVVGTAMAGYDGHRGWVYAVAVKPDRRRRGIGDALMARVEEGLRAMRCPKLNLQVRATNREAVAFYERLGYAVEDRVSMGKLFVAPGRGAGE
jgi:ribosomal protein S18 acetylase RimI-like enzyme